jgi:hypothetical protein
MRAASKPGTAAACTGLGSTDSSPSEASQAFSTRTWRFGTASRTTSLALPAARSASRRASAQTSGASTRAGETTVSSSLSVPAKAPVPVTSTMNPSATRPTDRSGTRTRTPVTASAAIDAGMP